MIGKLIIGSLYLRGRTIQEAGGKVIMGSCIYGITVFDGSLYSRLYGIIGKTNACQEEQNCAKFQLCSSFQ